MFFKKYARLYLTTDSDTGTTFDPTINAGASNVVWWLNGNESKVTGSSIFHTFASSGDKPVEVSFDDETGVTEMTMPSDGLKGDLDFRPFVNVLIYTFNGNTSIEDVLFPTTTALVTSINFSGAGITGNVDLSGMTQLGGSINFSNGNDISTISFPSTSVAITSISMQSGFDGTVLDFSPISNMQGGMNIRTNSNLQTVTYPSGGKLTSVTAYSCDIAGVQDFTDIDDLDCSFEMNNNDITGFTFPASTKINKFIVHSNPLTALDWSNVIHFSGTLNLSSCTSAFTPVTANATTGTVTFINTRAAGITGTFDLSGLNDISGSVQCDIMANCTKFLFPTTNGSIVSFQIDNCDITGTQDLSPLENLSGTVDVSQNPNMTGLTWHTSSGNISNLSIINTGLTTCDISDLTLSGTIDISANDDLTTITFPTTVSNSVTVLYLDSNDITGTLDLTPFTNLSGALFLKFNSLMTGLTMPTSTGVITSLNVGSTDVGYVDLTGVTLSNTCSLNFVNCGMSVANVNQLLVDADASGKTGLVIETNGNSATPDTTTGGFNGSAAKTSLIAKGCTVTTD